MIVPHPLQFHTGSATHVGMVREVNEDSHFIGADRGIWLVADGMGGHRNGRLASTTVVKAVQSVGPAASAPDLLARFKDRIHRANAELLELAGGDGDAVMGATVAALLVFGGHFACVWSGDSRVYRVRMGTISQLSKDHTEVQELIDRGKIMPSEAKSWPRRNVVTRAVGVFEDPALEVVQGELRDGDTFVLCSDGLTGHVGDDEILRSASQFQPQEACEKLIQLTLDRGAEDNVTVIVVNCQEDDRTVPGLSGDRAMSPGDRR
jgi:serine/threonine protein phosphatase PrpC